MSSCCCGSASAAAPVCRCCCCVRLRVLSTFAQYESLAHVFAACTQAAPSTMASMAMATTTRRGEEVIMLTVSQWQRESATGSRAEQSAAGHANDASCTHTGLIHGQWNSCTGTRTQTQGVR